MGRLAAWAILAVLVGLAITIIGLKFLERWDGQLHDRPFYAHKQRAGPLKVVVFGTSLSERAKWPDDLQQALQSCGLGDALVLRHAKAGANSSWGGSQAEWFGQNPPDLVIVEFAMNDADLFDGLSLDDSQSNHLEIVRNLRQIVPDAAILLLSTNPVTGWARLKRPLLARYYNSYVTVAAQADIGFLDGYGRWMQLPGRAEAIYDGVHPRPEIEAQLLAEPIAHIIATGFGAICTQDRDPAPTD